MSSISSSSWFSFIDNYTSYDSTDSPTSNRSISSTTPSSEVGWTTSPLPSTTSDCPLSPSLTSISSETYEFSDSSIGSERPHLPDFWEILASSMGSSTDSFISSDNYNALDNSSVTSPLSDPFLDNFSSSHMPTLPSTPISARSSTLLSSAVSTTTSPWPSNTSSDVSNPSLSSSSSSKSRRKPITECPPSQFFDVVNVISELMIIVDTDRLRLSDDRRYFRSHIYKYGYRDFYISDAPNGQSIVLFKTRSLAEEISKQRSNLHPYLSPFESSIDPTKEQFIYCKACKKVQLAYRGLANKKKDGCCSWRKVNSRNKPIYPLKLQLLKSGRKCPPLELFGVMNFTLELMGVDTDRLRLIDNPLSFKSHINHFGHTCFYISDAPNGRSIILFRTRQLAEEFSQQISDLHPYLSPFGSVIEDPKKELFAYCKGCQKIQIAYRGLDIKNKDGCCSWKKANARARKEKVDIQAKFIFSKSPFAINYPSSSLLSSSTAASSITSSIISPSIISSSTASSSEESSTSSTSPPNAGFVYCKTCKKVQLVYRGLATNTEDGCYRWHEAHLQADKERASIQLAALTSSSSHSAISRPASALSSPSMAASSTSILSSSIISPSTTPSSTNSSSEASSTSSTLPPTTDGGNSAAGLSNAFIFAAAYLPAFSCALEGLQVTTPTAIPDTPLTSINPSDSTTSSSSSSSAVASVASSKKRGISSGLPAGKKARLNSGKTILKSHRPS